ncbi:MAG: TolC family protein [Persephonella sp.]|nr:TolC family protein [Persephonella sp.]
MVLFRLFTLFLLMFSISRGETLQEVLDYALKNSPQIKAKIYEAKESEGEIKSAEAFPNPEAYIQFGRLYSQSESGFNLTELSIHQPLKLWGTRKNAVEEALLKREAARLQLQFYRNQIAGNIYKKFYETLYSKHLLQINKQSYNLSKSVYQLVKKSYQLGEETKLNLLRAEKELKLSQIELKQAENLYTAKLKELSALAGKDIKDVEGDFSKLTDFKDFSIRELPEIRYLEKISQSIDRAIQVQKGLSKPQIGVEFIAGEDAAELGKYEFGIGLTATVPVFYRKQGEIIKLINRKKSILSEKKQKELIYSSKIQNLKSRYFLLKKQLIEIDSQIIPSMEDALKLATESYRMRAITLLNFQT